MPPSRKASRPCSPQARWEFGHFRHLLFTMYWTKLGYAGIDLQRCAPLKNQMTARSCRQGGDGGDGARGKKKRGAKKAGTPSPAMPILPPAGGGAGQNRANAHGPLTRALCAGGGEGGEGGAAGEEGRSVFVGNISWSTRWQV
jgi:hypothetical protein